MKNLPFIKKFDLFSLLKYLDRCQDTCMEEMFLMENRNQATKLTITALLMAIAIIIPVIMPVKVVIGPASYTLASHVPIFIAMFFSPSIAVMVTLGATVGFFIGGFPIVIVLRALSQVLFAYIGAKILEKNQNEILGSFQKSQLFSLAMGLIHALGEMIVVSLFFFGFIGVTDTSNGFFYTVFLLVGVGTLIHSLVDFLIAQYIWKAQESRLTPMKLKIT